jgi:hypothetical protein
MAEPAKNITNLRPAQQEIVQSKQLEPWLRQKNEPALWYMRFKRYLDMGPKRSLRALVIAEPSTQKATRKQPEKKMSDVSVPGAWKRASKMWRWVERAEAYDLYQQSRYAQAIRETANELPYSSCAYRIMTLNSIAANLEAQIKPRMDMNIYMSIIARLQSIMRDIATEMSKLDGVTQEACDAGAARYSEKEKLEQETRDKLKNAAMHERNSIVFEAEERRRALGQEQPR